MNEWVRALRLACFEAAKLYEYYSAALVNERHPAVLAGPRAPAYQVQVRFSGTNDWAPCEMAISAGPARVTFVSQADRTQLAVLSSPRHGYAIYPDSLDSVDAAVIAKLEGDCDVDASLHPKIEDADDELPVATSRTHGSYALVIFQSPAEMAAALAETAACARLYRMPAAFAPDMVPDRERLYLQAADIADKSIEIMEPVTARRMLDNIAAERCPRLDLLPDHAGGYSTSGSTVRTDSTAAAPTPVASLAADTTRMPWDSDGSADEAVLVSPNGRHRTTAAAAASQPRQAKADEPASHEADTEVEAQPQKRHFRFLHKGGKSKSGSSRDSTPSLKEAIASNGSASKAGSNWLTKALSPTATSSANTSTASKEGMRNSPSERSLSHSSTAPSLPTPALGAIAQGTFADEAAEAIVNLTIVESPQPASARAVQADSAPARQLAQSDTESDSDAPLGDIVSRNAQTMGGAPRQQQQQQQQPPAQPMHPATMYRASVAMGGPQQ
ncbi:hypothetical protein IWQ56_005757, partial [Coemansia nantahalensis]